MICCTDQGLSILIDQVLIYYFNVYKCSMCLNSFMINLTRMVSINSSRSN